MRKFYKDKALLNDIDDSLYRIAEIEQQLKSEQDYYANLFTYMKDDEFDTSLIGKWITEQRYKDDVNERIIMHITSIDNGYIYGDSYWMCSDSDIMANRGDCIPCRWFIENYFSSSHGIYRESTPEEIKAIKKFIKKNKKNKNEKL